MFDYDEVLFRFSIGQQDTTRLSTYDRQKYENMLWLAKLAMVSFQKHFPKSHFIMLYNGYAFEEFKRVFQAISPDFLVDTLIVDQCSGAYPHGYCFEPLNGGVWMKWVPFRFDITKTEIAVDTDIVCINPPTTWARWIEDEVTPILVAPERMRDVCDGSCGDFSSHPILDGVRPLNCGVVGQRKGYNFAERFFEVANSVEYGSTKNSLFITEQGAINVWAYSLRAEGIAHTVLDFERNAWGRDCLYFLTRGISVETVHAVSWQKRIIKAIQPAIEKKVASGSSDPEFLQECIQLISHLSPVVHEFLIKQITGGADLSEDLLISDGASF